MTIDEARDYAHTALQYVLENDADYLDPVTLHRFEQAEITLNRARRASAVSEAPPAALVPPATVELLPEVKPERYSAHPESAVARMRAERGNKS